MTIVLGLNAYHGDASACLLRDGKLVAAAEEERFRRVKHWAGFPTEAVRWCLSDARVDLAQVAHVAVNQDPRASFWRKIGYLATQRPELSLILDRIRNKRERMGISETLARELKAPFHGTVHHVEHHLAHLAVHGFLHLVGYDHEKLRDAKRMESFETEILAGLGVPDPYASHRKP